MKAELDNLKTALEQVANLEPVPGLEETVFAAVMCQVQMREFLASVERYDARLGGTRSSGVMKDVAYKVRWPAMRKVEQVSKLRAELSGYVGVSICLLDFIKCFIEIGF